MDFGIVGFVFMPYFVPFIIAIYMPNRWALLGVALLLGLPVTWMAISYGRWADQADSGAFLDAVFGVAYFGAACVGLFAGVATRSILLWRRKRVTGCFSRVGIIFSGFILIPTCFFSFMRWEEWQGRMPSDNCIDTTHRVEINGALFDLPSAPFVHLWVNRKNIYFLGSTTDLREFCELAASTDKPVHAVNLYIETNLYQSGSNSQLHERFCTTTADRWGLDLCMGFDKTTNKNLVPNYPEDFWLHSPKEFGGHFNSIDNGAYSNFKKKIKMAVASNSPQISNSEGMFDVYTNGYRVARDGVWKNDSGEPYTLFCHEPTATGTIYCNTSYLLKTGVQIEFGFVTPQSNIDLVAKKVDENVHVIINTLVVK